MYVSKMLHYIAITTKTLAWHHSFNDMRVRNPQAFALLSAYRFTRSVAHSMRVFLVYKRTSGYRKMEHC